MKVAGPAVLFLWIYLLLFRGRFWLARSESNPPKLTANPPGVVVVVPARNEAATVGQAVASLAAQRYPGALQIIVVDDASSDATAAIARAAAPESLLTVIPAPLILAGWTGKLSAVAEGVRHAERFAPPYLFFTDADIVHGPDTIAALVARAEAEDRGLVSFMVELRCEALAERALIPAFVYFFFMLYPPAWIRDPRYATAGAGGGAILIRRATLEAIGGIAAIRGELIDDCALAAAVKRQGGSIWLGPTSLSRSVRPYTFGDIVRMISRTAFTQLRYSTVLLAGTLAGLAVTFLLPPILTLRGSWTAAAAWLLMSISYVPILRLYRRSPLWAPLLPMVAAVYAGATVQSALAYWQGAGGRWKGRTQAPRFNG